MQEESDFFPIKCLNCSHNHFTAGSMKVDLDLGRKSYESICVLACTKCGFLHLVVNPDTLPTISEILAANQAAQVESSRSE